MIVNYRFCYMKLLGFFTAIIGFSYSLTTCYNFFDLIFGNKIVVNGSNVLLMGIGTIFPLFIFVFGVFFYFYADVSEKSKWSNWVIITSCIINVLLCSKYLLNLTFLNNLFGLIHYSFGIVLLILNILFICGKYSYKY